jgi:phage-related minor tail protein
MTEERKIQLVAEVDTTPTRAGFNEIRADAQAMGESVARSSGKAGAAVDSIGAGAGASAAKVESSTRNLIGSIQRATAAAQAGAKSGADFYEALAGQRGVPVDALRPYLDQLRAVTTAQQAARQQLDATTPAMNRVGISAAQTAAALRGVPAQFTDIVTSIQGGQAPLTVFLQQGGQLRDMFGSAGAAARGLGGYILGLVNPYTVAAAAVAGLGYAYYQGSQEQKGYTTALISTGNAAGTTSGQLADMAKSIAKSSGTQSAAAAALTALVATGRVGAENLKEFGKTSADAQRVLGKAASETADEFAKLGKAPLQATIDLGEKYHFLTAATVAQIRALEAQGRAEEAGIVAQKEFSKALDERTKEVLANQGSMERGWNAVWAAAKGAADAALSVGRADTLSEKLLKVNAEIAKAQKPFDPSVGGNAEARAQLQSNIQKKNAIEQQIDAEKRLAAITAEKVRFDQADNKWKQDGLQYLTKEEQLRRAIEQATTSGIASGASDADIQERIKGIKRSFGDLNNVGLAQLEAARNLDKEVLAGQLADLESNHKQQLVTDQEFIERKRDLQLKDLAGEAALVKKQADLAGGKADLTQRATYLGTLTVLEQRRKNIIAGADDAIKELGTASSQAIKSQVAAWINATASEKQALTEEIGLFGQSASARAIATAQLKVDAEVRQKIADAETAKHPLSALTISDLKKEAEARKANIATLMGQQQALAGAEQLRLENQRFAVEAIADDQSRADAQLQIDAKLWQERIRMAGEGTEAQKLLQEQFDTWYANRQLAPVLDRWKGIVGNLDNDFREGFRDMLSHGQSAWSSFSKSIGNTLKTSLADALYQTFAKKYVLSVVESLAGSISGPAVQSALAGGGGAGSGITSAFSSASALNSAYSLSSQPSYLGQFASGYSGSAGAASEALGAPMTTSAQFGSYASSATPYLAAAGGGLAAYNVGQNHGAVAGVAAGAGTIAAGGALSGAAAGTGIAAGASAALAAIPVWGWAALAALAIVGSMQDGPEKDTRLQFVSNNTPGNISINERGNQGQSDSYIGGYGTSAFGTFGVNSSFWMNTDQPVVQDFIKTVSATDDALATFLTATEKASVATYLTGKTETAHTGEEGANPNANGQLDKIFADRINNILDGVQPGLSALEAGFTGTSQQLATEAAAVLQYRAALKDSGEALFGIKTTLVEVAALKQPTEATSAALQRVANEFATTNLVAQALGKGSDAFGAVGLASEAARNELVNFAGGLDKLSSQTSSFAQNYLTPEEQLAPVKKALDAALAGLGYSGARAITSRDQFKEVARSIDLSTEAGRKQEAQLLALADAFAQVHTVTVAATKSEQQIADERAGLQQQYDQLTLTSNQLLAQQRDALDASNRALFDQIQAHKAAADAAKAQQEAATSLLTDVDAAYAGLQRSVSADRARADSAHQAAMTAYQAQIDAVNTSVGKLQSLSGSLQSTLSGLSLPGQEESNRLSGQAQIAAALAIARAGGPLPDSDGIQSALRAATQESSSQFSSKADYQRNFFATARDIAELGDLTGNQLTVNEKILEATKAAKDAEQAAYDAQIHHLDDILANGQSQIDVLKGINTGVISVADAIIGLQSAISAAMANPVAAAPSAITSAYQQYLGRNPESAGLDYYKNLVANGTSLDTVVGYIKSSPEAQIENLYETVLKRHGEATGIEFWTKALNAGVSIDKIKQDFYNSDEYIKSLRGFAVGTNFVPSTMPALIHEGERVVPAADNRELIRRLRAPEVDTAALAMEMRALRQVVTNQQAVLRQIAVSTGKHVDLFDNATGGGGPMLVQVES